MGFIVLAVAMLCGLVLYYRRLPPGNNGVATVALALIGGGAAGNLLDRLRSSRGVVDFIDIGVGDVRFWTFNLADAGVFCGAMLLLLVLSRADSDGRPWDRKPLATPCTSCASWSLPCRLRLPSFRA